MGELEVKDICQLCRNATGKYVCPKCNILYCSLICYRSSNHQSCSEQFYRDSVMEELKLNKSNPEDALKMMSILKANSENPEDVHAYLDDDKENSLLEPCDSDDEDIKSLNERLAGIDLDNPEEVWAKLDDSERKEFIAMAQDFNSKTVVENWRAWWTHSYNNKIQELSAKPNFYKRCPVVGNISKFKDICKKDPHISVKYNLFNILAGYAFVTRYFNGEYSLFPRETMSFIAIISESLRGHQSFDDLTEAIKSIENRIIEQNWIIWESDNKADMCDDLMKIIAGPEETNSNYYIVAALCDIHNLLKKSTSKKTEEPDGGLSRAFAEEHFPISKIHTLKEFKLYMKRIEYFLSYVQSYYSK